MSADIVPPWWQKHRIFVQFRLVNAEKGDCVSHRITSESLGGCHRPLNATFSGSSSARNIAHLAGGAYSISYTTSRGTILPVVPTAGSTFAPNGREPRLLVAREPRRAEVTLKFDEAGRRDVFAPGVEIEEAAIAVIAQAFLVASSRVRAEQDVCLPETPSGARMVGWTRIM